MDTALEPDATTGAAVARPRQGSLAGLVALASALLVVCLFSLVLGSRDLDPRRVLEVLVDPDGSTTATIVRELRVPRTVLGVAVGTCLGVAGALMQGHTRNPLADPGLLGVNAGASFAVVLGIYVLGATSPLAYAWFAFAGAGVAATVVFLIGSARGRPDPVTLVLAGTAVSALLGSFTQTVLLRDVTTLDQYRFWVVGSLTGRDLDVLAQLAPFMVLGLLLALAGASGLNLLQLGDDVARSLGADPVRHQVVGILAVMLLAGAATAACGPIAFVGLVVPHVARHLGGVDYRWVVPYAGLVGAVLVVAADVIGRLVVRPGELQVGIVVALVGGPVFVLLVRRLRLVRLWPRPTYQQAVVRVGPVSGRIPLRPVAVCVASTTLLVVVLGLDLALGDVDVPLADVVAALLGRGDPGSTFIVQQLRLPQASVALVVGAALGLSGALCQTFARNPLASPDILGVTQGASVGAVALIVLSGGAGYGGGLVGGTLQRLGLPVAALAGALLTAAALYLLSWRHGIDGQRLVLVGIGLGAALLAVTDWLLVGARIQDAASAAVWLNGSLNARGWDQAVPVAVVLAGAVPVAIWLVRHLNTLQLGDDTARTLGVRLQTTQLLVLLVAVLLAAVAVSAGGAAGVRRPGGAAGRPAPGRWLAPAAARLGDPRSAPGRRRRPRDPGRPAVRGPGRRRDRGDRRAVPAVAPRPHQPEGNRMTDHPGSRLGAEAITVGYGDTPVISDLTFDVPDGQVTSIIGPNGCGKSTLLRTLARLLKPSAGVVRLDGEPIDRLRTRDVARLLALLPQSPVAPEGLLVRDLVGRGRHAHQRWFSQWSADDHQAIEAAMEMTDTAGLGDRAVDELSGGQRQRAWIAMTLAQETDLVLLDEPTTYLDLAHQVEVLDLVTRLNRERGRTVAMVLHDLNLAARYSDVVVVMKAGAIVAQGGPAEIITPDLLGSVFGLRAEVLPDPRTGLPIVVPTSSAARPGGPVVAPAVPVSR